MELLIQVTVDAVNPTIHPVGDVIAFAPIGHRWGKEELAHPHWRIVCVPGMGQHEAEALCGNEIPTRHGQKVRLRGMTLDVAALGLAAVPRNSRRPHTEAVEATHDHSTFRAASTVKPVVR